MGEDPRTDAPPLRKGMPTRPAKVGVDGRHLPDCSGATARPIRFAGSGGGRQSSGQEKGKATPAPASVGVDAVVVSGVCSDSATLGVAVRV